MIERQPQQEERMRQPLVTIDAVKSADQQCSRQQPRTVPFVFSSGSPQKPSSPKIDRGFKRCGLPMEFGEVRRGRAAFHVVHSGENSGCHRQHRPIAPSAANSSCIAEERNSSKAIICVVSAAKRSSGPSCEISASSKIDESVRLTQPNSHRRK